MVVYLRFWIVVVEWHQSRYNLRVCIWYEGAPSHPAEPVCRECFGCLRAMCKAFVYMLWMDCGMLMGVLLPQWHVQAQGEHMLCGLCVCRGPHWCSMLHSCHHLLDGAWLVVHLLCIKIHLCVMRVVDLVCYAAFWEKVAVAALKPPLSRGAWGIATISHNIKISDALKTFCCVAVSQSTQCDPTGAATSQVTKLLHCSTIKSRCCGSIMHKKDVGINEVNSHRFENSRCHS